MDYSERKEVTHFLNGLTLAVGAASLPFFWWGYSQENGWLKAAGYAQGVLGMGLSAMIQTQGDHISRRLDATKRMRDQLEVQLLWETRGGALKPPTEGGIDVKMDMIPTLKWDDFVTNYINRPELYAHVGIFAPTGFGKTLTAEVIGDLRAAHYRRKGLSPRKIYVSPTLTKEEHEFLGWEPQGVGFKKEELGEFTSYLQKELIDRYSVDDKRPPLVIGIDEYRWIAQKLSEVPIMTGDVLSLGRRKEINLILIAQGDGVKTLKLEGEGQLRAQMVTVYKGGIAASRVSTLESEGIFPPGSSIYFNQLLETNPYGTCLVNDKLLLLPDLSTYRTTKVERGITYREPPSVLIPEIEVPPSNSETPVPRRSRRG